MGRAANNKIPAEIFRELEKAVPQWLFLGSFRGFLRKVAGKFREKMLQKLFPNREMLEIPGSRAPGKANLPRTLGGDLVTTFCAVFFEIGNYSLLEFF